MFGKCQREGCERPATVAPVACVPATGYPRDFKPVRMILGLKTCRDHAADAIDLKASFAADGPDDGKLRKAVDILTKGKVPPDYSRAYVTATRLDGEEWAQFERMRA